MSKKITSLTNKIWHIKNDKNQLIDSNRITDILLENRNIKNVRQFLNSTVKNFMPDPFHFLDMEKAVNRIIKSIENKETITLFGDYDVDGVSSTSIFIKFFEHIKTPYQYLIPNRIDDGYGISKENINKYKDSLIITVDCGSNAIDELKYAKENNIDIIVIDHHKMSSIPKGIAIVNPHRPDENKDYKYLCATGLAFICIVGINRALKCNGLYKERHIKEPDLIDYLDLVALATVCDVMDLIELNRAFVSTGIKVIQRRKNLGIDALISIGKMKNISSDTLSFFFGPRINAAGRISNADLSVKLLTTQNPIEARNLALQLNELNKNRQQIESKIVEEALQRINEELNFICLYDKEWHVGIVGIVAGRLKEKYNKPTFIISIDNNGYGKASCRSIDGIDISEIIKKAIKKDIILSGGGHAMAAGFSIKEEMIESFIDFLKFEIKYNFPLKELYADCFLPVKSISTEIVKSISRLEPFGSGNIHPKFVIPNMKVASHKIVGKKHIQVTLEDEEKNQLNAISFKSVNSLLGNIIMEYNGIINILGAISLSEWNGKECISISIEDISKI